MLFVIFLAQLFWPLIVVQILDRAELLSRVYGVESAEIEGRAESDHEQFASNAKLWSARRSLWVSALAFPLQAATVIGLLWAISRTRLYQLGLTAHRFGHNLMLGLLGWSLFAPVVFGVNLVITLIYRGLLHQKEEEHPLGRVLRFHPQPFEIVLILATAVVAAPFLEELIFRGLLQPWFASRRWGGLVALACAFALAFYERGMKIVEGWRTEGVVQALHEASALGFVLLMIPGYFLVRGLVGMLGPRAAHRRQLAQDWAGSIYATALLFAAAHSFAWPTPVALFVLALGLGYLAYRTQNLGGPILLHALFNGVSCAIFLLLPQPEKGNPVTTAVPLNAPASNSSAVPGS